MNMQIVGILWPAVVFLSLGAIFIPVYILLVFAILKDRLSSPRFNTAFHNLVISLAIGDILAVIYHAYCNVFKDLGFFSDFYWNNRESYWTAPMAYNSVYLFLFVRCFGAALISLQRYVTVCKSHSWIGQVTFKMSFWKVVLVHWIPPIVYCSPIAWNTNIIFDSIDTLKLIVQPFDLKYAMFSGDVFCFITFLICISAYFFVLRQFKSAKMSRSLRKEFRITIQVVGPVLAITCAFVFYSLQLIFTLRNQTEITFFMRSIYPVVTGFMSYVNPLVYLLFSDDLRKLIVCTLRCRTFEGGTPSGTNVRVVPSSAFSSTEVRQ